MKTGIMEKIVVKVEDFELSMKMLKEYDNLDEAIKATLEKTSFVEQECRLVLNPHIVRERKIEEQIKLIDFLRQVGYDHRVNELIENVYLLENRTTDEQIELIEKYLQENRNRFLYKIIVSPDVLANRTIDEQLLLMNICQAYNYISSVLSIALDPKILKESTIEEQIEMMKSKVFDTHSNNLDAVTNQKELQDYVRMLVSTLGRNTDVSLDGVVPILKKEME